MLCDGVAACRWNRTGKLSFDPEGNIRLARLLIEVQ
jgi:hypothetical protein